MKAELLLRRRIIVSDTEFAELILWQLPEPVPPCQHFFKYRLAFIANGVCVIRYDNERGKGDHRHVGPVESDYAFSSPDRLIVDFRNDIERWRHEHRDA